MIIDTSALIAILRAEDDASDMAHAIEQARDRQISAGLPRLRPGQRPQSGAGLRRLLRLRPRQGTGQPLLYQGNDFTHTDITPALPAAD